MTRDWWMVQWRIYVSPGLNVLIIPGQQIIISSPQKQWLSCHVLSLPICDALAKDWGYYSYNIPISGIPVETNTEQVIHGFRSRRIANICFLCKFKLLSSFQFRNNFLLSMRTTRFTKRAEILPHDLIKSRSRKIGCDSDHITLKFDRPRCLSNFKAIGKV